MTTCVTETLHNRHTTMESVNQPPTHCADYRPAAVVFASGEQHGQGASGKKRAEWNLGPPIYLSRNEQSCAE